MTQLPLDPVARSILAGRHSRRALLGQGAALGASLPMMHALMRPGSAAAEGGIVTVGISTTPTTMDLSKPDWVSWWGTNYLYDTLLSTDDNETFIPLLARLWRAGRFPIERLVRTFPLAEIDAAERAAAAGEVVKPVLLP